MHQGQRAPEAALPQLALQPAHVAVHQRLHESVGAGGDQPLIFPQLGDHVGGQRDRDVRQHRANDFAGFAFVRGIAVGMQEADGDRFDAFGGELAGGVAHRFTVQRVIGLPSRSIRSATSSRRRRGTRGSGYCRNRS